MKVTRYENDAKKLQPLVVERFKVVSQFTILCSKNAERVFFYVSRYPCALIFVIWEKYKHTYIAMGQAPH